MKISGIYKIQSLIKPERIYIGSAINIASRWCQHLSKLKKGNHASKKLQNHFNKYGKNDLMFSILFGCAKDNLISTEQFFIDAHKPWFNIRLKAESNLGIVFSDETKKIMSESKKGNKNFLGKHHSEETKLKMSKRHIGKTHTKECRVKMGENHRGVGRGLLHLQYLKENIDKKSQTELAKELNISQSTISKIFKNENKKAI